MSLTGRIRWALIGILGRAVLWLWAKSARIKVLGDEKYRQLREKGEPAVILVWHGRIFIVPYFFRRRGIMPLISPSKDGEIVARIMTGWGYKILRGSSSHAVIKAWNEMRKELLEGGELIIVPDGPRGPDRKFKPGGLKLAQETGAHLVPFTFSASRKSVLKSWDSFLLFRPFSRVVVLFGEPFPVRPGLTVEEFEEERRKAEAVLVELDEKADAYFHKKFC